MYAHLKEREYYEDSYDHLTVEMGRSDDGFFNDFLDKFTEKMPKGTKIDGTGNALLVNTAYMQLIGDRLIRRYNEREQTIREWMARDESKDDQIAEAQLSEEPYCQHCHKQGLRITDKSLMHRKRNAKYDDPKEVLFMLHCPHCDKNSAFWEDGTAWKPKPTLCPKCRHEMTHKTRKGNKVFTFTYTCPSCGHSYKDKLDMVDKPEPPDPDYDKDRIHYCLLDKEFRDHLFGIKDGFEKMAELGKEMKEKQDNKHIYDAVAEMKKPKIAELVPLLSEPLEKAGYVEFRLEKPEMGKDVFVGFSCLDNKSDRGDYDSQNTLKKLIKTALAETNWRLMSEGIHYRLGYLSGRLRAYEREEDLKELVMKDKKLQDKFAKKQKDKPSNPRVLKTPDGKEVIL